MLALKQEQLFDAIDVLPIDLKAKMVDKILASIVPTDDLIDELWVKEAYKRKHEIESSSIDLIDGNEVFQINPGSGVRI